MSKQCLTSSLPNKSLVTRNVSILEVFTFMNFLRALTKVVKLCFSPNSSVLCSNGGWLAPFCASSFSLDWKAITLMGGRLIWLIPTLEYRPVIGWSISQGSGGTTMHNYKNNRSIIRVQVQPEPCDDKYNALCTNTNTSILQLQIQVWPWCFCVSGPFSPMRLAWVGRCGDTGWIQMSSSWEEAWDDLWSTWQQKFNLLDLARANQIFRRIHGVMVVMWTSFYAK